MSFPPYPEYKHSGIEWLGEIPSHWSVLPIKAIGKLKAGAGFPHEEQEQLFLQRSVQHFYSPGYGH